MNIADLISLPPAGAALVMPGADSIAYQIERDRALPAEVWSVDELLKRPIQG